MNAEQLKEILDQHAKWLVNNSTGARANLTWADLTGADLTRANLPKIPAIENIDSKILEAIKAPGCSLNMRDWHTCETTHCRAGWAITLAGDCGALLESIYGPSVAGSLIYAVSRPGKPIPNFTASNEEAMADLIAGAANTGD